MDPRTAGEALRLLAELGADRWLIRHHELVVEAGQELFEALPSRWLTRVDRQAVQIGCALHDAGKVLWPAEQRGPGHRHEEAGRRLLEERGLSARLSRFCVTHARWSEDSTAEDLLVALADVLWKGARIEALEALAVHRLAAEAGLSYWDVEPKADAAFERIASGGDERLARSRAG